MLLSFVWRNCHRDVLLVVGRCGRGSVDLALLVSQTGCEGSPSVISCATPGIKCLPFWEALGSLQSEVDLDTFPYDAAKDIVVYAVNRP